MFQNLFADHIISVAYTGSGAVHTVSFDANGGTNTDGLLLLTDDDGANSVNLNDGVDGVTLQELVVAVRALGDWEAYPAPGLPYDLDCSLTNLSAATRPLADYNVATPLQIGQGRANAVIPMATTNAFEYATKNSASTVPKLAVPIPCRECAQAIFRMHVDSASAAAAENVTITLAADPSRNPFVLEDYRNTGTWDTVTISANLVVALNGTSEARESQPMDLRGYGQVKVVNIVNADVSHDCNVWGGISFPGRAA